MEKGRRAVALYTSNWRNCDYGHTECCIASLVYCPHRDSQSNGRSGRLRMVKLFEAEMHGQMHTERRLRKTLAMAFDPLQFRVSSTSGLLEELMSRCRQRISPHSTCVPRQGCRRDATTSRLDIGSRKPDWHPTPQSLPCGPVMSRGRDGSCKGAAEQPRNGRIDGKPDEVAKKLCAN